MADSLKFLLRPELRTLHLKCFYDFTLLLILILQTQIMCYKVIVALVESFKNIFNLLLVREHL
jgi:hypothetical protein